MFQRAMPVSYRLSLALTGVLVLGVSVSSALAQDWVQPERSQANLDALARVQQKTYTFEEAGNTDQEYRVYIPTAYDGSAATPLVIALHGLGSGTMYMMEYNNLVELAERYGYIVATPMGYTERGWYGARGQGNDFNRRRQGPGPENLGALSEQDVLNVLAIIRDDYNVDDSRIYLIGQSMGGGGTWYLGSKYAEIWAALAPLAPAVYISPDILETATHLPVMVVMGDADTAVDVKVTRQWVAKMQELGMSHEYIEVPGGSHSSAGRENIGKVFAFLDTHRKP
jgi:predicted peptidase